MQNQVYTFFIFILNGFLIGLLFDAFRIFRKSFKTPDILTYVQDILFWILTGLLILFSIFKFNNGELRSYIFLGMLFGISIYLLVFSRVFIKISVTIITFISKIVTLVIIVPIKYILKLLRKIIFKPISFIFINLKKFKSLFVYISKIKHIRKVPNEKRA